jgi:hypothetical protein
VTEPLTPFPNTGRNGRSGDGLFFVVALTVARFQHRDSLQVRASAGTAPTLTITTPFPPTILIAVVVTQPERWSSCGPIPRFEDRDIGVGRSGARPRNRAAQVTGHATAALKEDAFGGAKVLLQQGRLILPRHPALLLQLSALEYEQSDSGVLKISVPERRGHDDLALGLALALQADPSVGSANGYTASGVLTNGNIQVHT